MAKFHELGPLPELDNDADEQVMAEITEAFTPLVNRHINPKGDPADQDAFPTSERYFANETNVWTPALQVPWSVGENFPKNYIWTPEDSPLPIAARSALIVGLLTEDNLPWYAETIDRKFGDNETLSFWNRIWTAEEGRHSEVMRMYMSTARLVDPVQLEKDRMAQVINAEVPDPPTAVETMVYVTFQELATRVSHMNTGKLIGSTALSDNELFPLNDDRTALANIEHADVARLEPEQRDAYIRNVGRAIMTRVARDEGRHFALYRDSVGNGALPLNPSLVVKAIERQVRGFEMPGTGIRDFWNHAAIIADAGVYDLRTHHDKIIKPVLDHWKFEELDGLDDSAKESRERTLIFMDDLDKIATKQEDRREIRRNKNPDAEWVGKAA